MKIIRLVLILLACQAMLAQAQTRPPGASSGGVGGVSKDNKKEENDSVVSEIVVWKMIEDFTLIDTTQIDTLLENYQWNHPQFKHNIGAQDLGNVGTAYQSLSYFERPDQASFLFNQNYGIYQNLAKDQVFYNTTTPYTMLDYGQWFSNRPDGETRLRAFHTQNPNQFTNVGIEYNTLTADGNYLEQRAKPYFFNIFGSYQGDRYEAFATFTANRINLEENGGFRFSDDIEDPDLDPENIPTWFTGATNGIFNANFMYSHQYKLGRWQDVTLEDGVYEVFVPRLTFMHTFEYSRDQKRYREENTNPSLEDTDTGEDRFFYGDGHTPLISDDETNDYAQEVRFTNIFHINLLENDSSKYTFGKRAFIGNDILTYENNNPLAIPTPSGSERFNDDYVSENEHNLFVGGSIYRTKGEFWNWRVTGKYYLSGYKSQDFYVDGYMNKPIRTKRDTSFLELTGKMSLETPSYFKNNYFSNHFAWSNSFNREYELKFGAKYSKPSIRLEAGANVSLLNDYVYFGTAATPQQADKAFTVGSVYLKKKFTAGPLHSNFHLLYQVVSDDSYMRLPTFVAKNTTYLQAVYAKVLTMQLGFDIRYNTNYYADAYMPALNQYYLQDEVKIGNYPWIDPYFSMKIKRMRFYIKYSNMSSLFLDTDYFTSPGYAQQPAVLNFGLSWSFYD